jgi:hypothetical protein
LRFGHYSATDRHDGFAVAVHYHGRFRVSLRRTTLDGALRDGHRHQQLQVELAHLYREWERRVG